ncbi:MAG: DMT family transporter [Candidatus Dormibacteraeota bacterium]|nr:DMT family transporter [Candidatus Dormibacteraeota bacterium]
MGLLGLVFVVGVAGGTQQFLLGAISRQAGPFRAAALSPSVTLLFFAILPLYYAARARAAGPALRNLGVAVAMAAIGGGYLAEAALGRPWYFYGPGFLGFVLVAGTAYAVPRLGTAAAATGVVAGQMAASLLWDQLGLFGLAHVPLGGLRVVGAVILVTGAVLVVRRQTK